MTDIPGQPTPVTRTISAQNTFTDWFSPEGPKATLSISGTWAGTITLQRKRRSEAASAARDVQGFSANAELNFDVVGEWDYRLGFKTSAYTSGDAVCELSAG